MSGGLIVLALLVVYLAHTFVLWTRMRQLAPEVSKDGPWPRSHGFKEGPQSTMLSPRPGFSSEPAAYAKGEVKRIW